MTHTQFSVASTNLVFGSTLQNHSLHKIKFHSSVNALSNNGFIILPEKITAIKNFKWAQTIAELQSQIGMLNACKPFSNTATESINKLTDVLSGHQGQCDKTLIE